MDMIFTIFSAIFGACFGSFITMASHRLPLDEDLFFKKSYCPKCKKIIGYFSLIPVFSWIFQKGRCFNCGQKISIRYPLTEVITALFFVTSYTFFGYSLNTIIVDLIFVCCMIMIITDLEHYIIPDSMQLCLLVFGLFFIYYNYMDILYSVFSAISYFLIIYSASFIVEKWKKKDAIGGGDLKFVAIAGLYLGAELMPYFFLFAGLIGMVFGFVWNRVNKKEYFPFGPALILSFLVLLFLKFK